MMEPGLETGGKSHANRSHPAQWLGTKMKTLTELGGICAQARAAGEIVVLAHGVFDLLHMGHVRHLQEARSHGTRLIVTITPDGFVNKGPNRPVFSDVLRMEMLAALSFVDYVAVNVGSSAEPAIEAVKPHVYVKGSDYANPADDVTGKIGDEQRLVESYGGRIVFTQDITFSSTELINRYFNPFQPAVRSFLEGLRGPGEIERIRALIEQAAPLRVLIVGDTIIDEYRYVQPMSKTPKENLVATLHQFVEQFAGGALATANHVASLCRTVDVLTLYGGEDDHSGFIADHMRPNVRLHTLVRKRGPTTRKCRYVDQYSMRKLFEVYHMDDSLIADDEESFFVDFIQKNGRDYDLVLVNDFGHGMITPAIVKALTENARFLAVNTQTNSANFGYNLITKYPRADYVCIDGAEARLAVRDKSMPMEALIRDKLIPAIQCSHIIVTQGSQGCTGYAAGELGCEVPAFADKVVDTVGAGDAFLAITAPLMAVGGALRHVAFIGNIAGALKVGIVGHRQSIEKAALLKSIMSLLR